MLDECEVYESWLLFKLVAPSELISRTVDLEVDVGLNFGLDIHSVNEVGANLKLSSVQDESGGRVATGKVGKPQRNLRTQSRFEIIPVLGLESHISIPMSYEKKEFVSSTIVYVQRLRHVKLVTTTCQGSEGGDLERPISHCYDPIHFWVAQPGLICACN